MPPKTRSAKSIESTTKKAANYKNDMNMPINRDQKAEENVLSKSNSSNTAEIQSTFEDPNLKCGSKNQMTKSNKNVMPQYISSSSNEVGIQCMMPSNGSQESEFHYVDDKLKNEIKDQVNKFLCNLSEANENLIKLNETCQKFDIKMQETILDKKKNDSNRAEDCLRYDKSDRNVSIY